MKKLSIHTLMHVPFEGLGCIEQWITKNNHSLSYTHFYEQYQLPNPIEFDWLIIMGGPMSVNDNAIYPWLAEEKLFIRQAIDEGKIVIGICLGSQLIAEVLGAKVYPNKQKEIGWFKIKQSETDKIHPSIKDFENQFFVFHWHGDTYDLPINSIQIFSSEMCVNQAFLFNDKVLGLQFHFEVTPQTLKEMIENGKDELIESKSVQTSLQILEQTEYIDGNNRKMFQLLDYFANTVI